MSAFIKITATTARLETRVPGGASDAPANCTTRDTMTIWTCHFSVAPKYILISMINGFRGKALYQGMSHDVDLIHKNNHEKSQTITIGKTQESKFNLGNMTIDSTETYNYLGITINNKGTTEYHIQKLKGKTEAALQIIFNLAGNKNFNQIEMNASYPFYYAAETWLNVEHNIQTILYNILKRNSKHHHQPLVKQYK